MTIPPALLKRHPEFPAILDAVEQHRQGRPVTSTCVKCRNPLIVTEVPQAGALHVTCPCGHIKYRASKHV